MIRDRRILTRALALAFAAILLTSAAAWSAPRAKHVFVVSLDGAGPPYLKQSNMPNVFGFVRTARTATRANDNPKRKRSSATRP